MSLGDITEAAFAYRATERNYNVFLPMSGHAKCDVVLKHPQGHLIGVQVKKAAKQKHKKNHTPRWKFMACSSLPSSASKRYNIYYPHDFDVYAVYIQELDYWAFYTIDELSDKLSHSWVEHRSRKDNWDLFDKFLVENSLQDEKKTQ